MFSTVRFSADNWNKLKNVCSKQIGEKMKVYKALKNPVVLSTCTRGQSLYVAKHDSWNVVQICISKKFSFWSFATSFKYRVVVTIFFPRDGISRIIQHLYLLYLPTQIRFPIGGKSVTWCWSKLTNSLGRKKIANSLGDKQHELSTRMWLGCAPWNRGMSQPI